MSPKLPEPIFLPNRYLPAILMSRAMSWNQPRVPHRPQGVSLLRQRWRAGTGLQACMAICCRQGLTAKGTANAPSRGMPCALSRFHCWGCYSLKSELAS